MGSEVVNDSGRKGATEIFEWGRRDGVYYGRRSTTMTCDHNATPAVILFGTQNPELLGPENKVFGVILGRDPLHGLRLATIKEVNQW